jgi:hypothetical protein
VVPSGEFGLVVLLILFMVLVEVTLVVIVVAAASSAGALALVVSSDELMFVVFIFIFIEVTFIVFAATTGAGTLALVAIVVLARIATRQGVCILTGGPQCHEPLGWLGELLREERLQERNPVEELMLMANKNHIGGTHHFEQGGGLEGNGRGGEQGADEELGKGRGLHLGNGVMG